MIIQKKQSSSSSSRSIAIYLFAALVLLMIVFQAFWLTLSSCQTSTSDWEDRHHQQHIAAMLRPVDVSSVNSLRHSPQVQSHNKDKDNPDEICHWYMAESAIPHSGLGMFAGTGVLPGEPVGFPDVCIFVSDAPKQWTHLRSHSFGKGSFFGQYEGHNSRAACEGFTTNYNTVPTRLVNTQMWTPMVSTHAGVHRQDSPAAGSFTHHFGMQGRAVTTITAGSELTLDYGDWDFTKKEENEMTKPERPVEWLQEHGWCIDNVRIGVSTIPGAGRGAFVRRSLQEGDVVMPLPLQVFSNRSLFQTTHPEQLYVNYCLQSLDPDFPPIMVYPYGPAFNLVNHNSETPNVKLEWSNSNMHHSAWLDLEYEEFWKVVTPGSLVLEVVAVRDLAVGEELLFDYGPIWEDAWEDHVATWTPPANADSYVYAAEMDETAPLRTMKEQETDPYPANLITMCSTPDWDRDDGRHIDWYKNDDYQWWELMSYCHILEKKIGKDGNYEYTVSLLFDVHHGIPNLAYDPSIPRKELYLDRKVPRWAIRFIERPYVDDEHLENAFRQPIELPTHLLPSHWRESHLLND